METSHPSSIPPAWLESVPVFPLPRVVFFPGTVLPLHIFEQRYREMMRDCVSQGHGLMAVTLLKPGFEENYEGRPPIETICGLGRLEQHEELPDGRFNLVLRGIARVKVEEHPPSDQPYRRAHATYLDGKRNNERCPRDAITTLLSTAALVATSVRRVHPDFSLGAHADDAPHQIADTLADRLVADPEIRQSLLEILDVHERVRALTSHVAGLLGQSHAAGSSGPLQ